ncbi:hypothetical protein HAX54_044380 [Datura stramonium]|uniref:Uncharacterized protein n=1 Tax=Datura stramonium TaxID=4076 RepID=A0ABS8SP42_DATST|nr:hypothetical protein [Datura stramonium]
MGFSRTTDVTRIWLQNHTPQTTGKYKKVESLSNFESVEAINCQNNHQRRPENWAFRGTFVATNKFTKSSPKTNHFQSPTPRITCRKLKMQSISGAIRDFQQIEAVRERKEKKKRLQKHKVEEAYLASNNTYLGKQDQTTKQKILKRSLNLSDYPEFTHSEPNNRLSFMQYFVFKLPWRRGVPSNEDRNRTASSAYRQKFLE